MEIKEIHTLTDKICENISKVLIGREEEIHMVVTAIAAGGHILIEDRPGTGKRCWQRRLQRQSAGNLNECSLRRI